MALNFSHSSSSQSLLLEKLMIEVALAYPLERSPLPPTRPKNTTPEPDDGPVSRMAGTLEPSPAITQASQSATISRSSTWAEDISLGLKASRLSSSDASGLLARQNTILAGGSSPSRGARELKAILGSSNAKLKTGATLPPPDPNSQVYLSQESLLRLEGGRSGARVQLDLLLENDSCVDGGYLNGTVLLTVRKKSEVVMLSDGKLRLVGFECIMQEKERHIFYQCTSPLSAVTNNLEDLYLSGSDAEGFKLANEGHFVLPFSFPLDPSTTYGAPKGIFPSQSGAAIRSIRIKDPISEQKSIAHFYRNICTWPRLDLAECMNPLPRPIQVTMSDSERTLKLTVTLTRLQWIAGQRCYLKFSVTNQTSRAIKSFTIGLHQDVIIYRPRDDSAGTRKETDDVRTYRTSTTSKLVTESTVMMGDRSEKGYVSAKGWWTGVLPGESLQFNHYLVLPPDTISIPKGRLLEVDYRLRVTISTGSLLPTELSAEVPIRIVNFISFDPAPSAPITGPAALNPQPAPKTAQAQHTSSKVLIDTVNSSVGSVYSDDEDEIVQDVIFAAPFPDSEDGPHFADLYYSTLESSLNQGLKFVAAAHEPDSDLSAFEELQLSPIDRKGKHTRTRSSPGSKPSRSDNVDQMSVPMSPGSVSVKDKIRELEERVKAIENVSKGV
ncbi:hypothetical protein EST38_g1835 [Candolleomyces aberdarensis]|uniref:Arrestin C-terminal-like domain-containing protein n=1 Tax=Candolleomyces aberdarensis TaxID=2316362 RepID=A0A4Q2DX46_9AGAR|nr:hypothetical protein EST38_g1835 [Candolleomyces aberdarensis]